MVSNDFSYDDISCDGGEEALDDCVHANVENCGPNEGAGVECYTGEVTSTIEDILAENIIHRIAPCKHCPKTFIEIFTPYTFSEKASPFLSS